MADDDSRRSKGAGWKSVYDTLRTEILALALPPGTCEMGVGRNQDPDLHRSFRMLLSRVRTAPDRGWT